MSFCYSNVLLGYKLLYTYLLPKQIKARDKNALTMYISRKSAAVVYIDKPLPNTLHTRGNPITYSRTIPTLNKNTIL